MQHRDRMLAGYKVIYKPNHFNHTLNKKGYNGYVYEHRYVMECEIGRALLPNEVVHHIDGDKLNNEIDNLQLTTRIEHAHIHAGHRKTTYCIDCGKALKESRAKRCKKCSAFARRKVKERPSKDELRELLQTNSYVTVGKMFNVSDNTIRKWLYSSEG